MVPSLSWTSQSYSCWYWVLSEVINYIRESLIESQSSSCWYWVLSYQDKYGTIIVLDVSILFLLVLGSVLINKTRNAGIWQSLNPILAGTGFCLKFQIFRLKLPIVVSILFLLVLGSVSW